MRIPDPSSMIGFARLLPDAPTAPSQLRSRG
jgi:hypothetical protein